MLKAVSSARRQVAQTKSHPAPVGGWNRRDSIAAMPPTDAVQLDNLFPTASDVMLRKGSDDHVTGITGTVETLVTYRPQTGSHAMFGFAGTAAYNMTAAGAVGAAVLSTLTNARWQCINFGSSGGHYLLCVNGADNMRIWDGSAWTTITAVSTPAITGVLTTALVNVNVYKERPYYVEAGSMSVWYPAVGAFAGALTEFTLEAVFKRGGYLMAMGTWSLDAGLGLDDLAVFITSVGEVAVYSGTDPGDTAWALIGLYNIGSPIGRRCIIKYGGDLLIITVDGVIPASKAFVDDRTSGAVAITDKIQGAMADSAALYGSNFGWSLTQFPTGSMLILNVPVNTGEQEQYVMNSVTGAWCRFLEWPAACFEILNDALYFGASTKVVKAWTGQSDNDTLITAEMVQAFNYLGSRSRLKQALMMRPIISYDVPPSSLYASVDVDYKIQTPMGEISFPSSASSVWDTATWDTSVWGGGLDVSKNWYTVQGEGYAFAAHLKFSALRSNIRIAAFDHLFQYGGVL